MPSVLQMNKKQKPGFYVLGPSHMLRELPLVTTLAGPCSLLVLLGVSLVSSAPSSLFLFVLKALVEISTWKEGCSWRVGKEVHASPLEMFLGSLCITGGSCTRSKEGGQKADPLVPASRNVLFGKGMGHVNS